MDNERLTEDIVREHFKRDKLFTSVKMEEQISSIPKVDKLLKFASKSGPGRGKPEFIISFPDNPDLLIVVECKPDILYHESETRRQYKDYAVDGVLLYSSFLSKEFDTLSIAVSGSTSSNLKVSYFMQRIGKEAEPIFGNKLIPIEDIIAGITQDKIKREEKYEDLLDYSKILNGQLHKLKIKEDKRSLLVSGILIALKNKDFYRSYASITSPQMLSNALVDTVKFQLTSENLQGDKIDKLLHEFNFIRNHPSLTKEKQSEDLKNLKELIDDIDENINGYARTYKYYDVLGPFYIEFLRYSNSDKGLGIVLTPPHITELFTELSEIKKDDIVFDNCTGTAGFLVASMKKMVDLCQGNLQDEKQVKQHQLYGIEFQPEIYPLAVSNMFLHGDGKSNIYSGNCFDNEIKEEIISKKPTVAFLNPPYKSDKKEDTEELEFIANALDCLCKNGRCIAIIPMSCVLATKKSDRLRLKELLLSKHTLKAVLSMPNELFFNSNVGTNTCIVVFEAHNPHSEKKKTFFGYYKDDGFSKRKAKGRFNYDKKWENIKHHWLDLYLNNQAERGLSVLKQVSATDEWCAEAYMETDYQAVINENIFKQTIKDYCVYLLANNFKENIIADPIVNKNITLEPNKWKYFNLESDLFEIKGSKTTPPLDILVAQKGNYPYVTTQATNNGVSGAYDFYTEKGNIITIDSAIFGYASYQKDNFSASDHVEKLVPKFKLDPYIAMFLVTILNIEQYRYNYGRKASQTRLKVSKIKLPVDCNDQPDWVFMQEYIKSLPYSSNLNNLIFAK